MTTLRRVGAMTLIPGIPAIPATPSRSVFVNIPDPPSQTELAFGGAGIKTQTIFGANSTVVVNAESTNKTGGNGRPPTPTITNSDAYNGSAGEYVTVVSPDGSIKVVRL